MVEDSRKLANMSFYDIITSFCKTKMLVVESFSSKDDSTIVNLFFSVCLTDTSARSVNIARIAADISGSFSALNTLRASLRPTSFSILGQVRYFSTGVIWSNFLPPTMTRAEKFITFWTLWRSTLGAPPHTQRQWPRLHESVGHNGKIRSANFRKKSDNRTRLHEQSAALNGIFRYRR